MLSGSQAAAKLGDNFRLPLGEVAADDVLAGVAHQAQIEGKVVDARDLEGKQLLCLEQVMEVGLAVETVEGAARGVDGGEVVLPFLVAHVHRALVGEEVGVATVTGGHHAVEHVDAALDCLQDVLGGAHAHQVAGAVLGKDAVHHFDHLIHHLRGLADGKTADGVTVGSFVGGMQGGIGAKVLVSAALHDGKQALAVAVERCGLFHATHATVEPALGEAKALFRITVVAVARGAFIERHYDVGSDDTLRVYHVLRGEDVLGAVDVGAEFTPLLTQLADARQGEHLEAAGVGEDGTVPCVETMQTAGGTEDFKTGTKVEVVGVAQDDPGAYLLAQLAEMHTLHAAAGAYGHEDGGLYLTMVGGYPAGAGGTVGVDVLEFKGHGRWEMGCLRCEGRWGGPRARRSRRMPKRR